MDELNILQKVLHANTQQSHCHVHTVSSKNTLSSRCIEPIMLLCLLNTFAQKKVCSPNLPLRGNSLLLHLHDLSYIGYWTRLGCLT
ncbi:hypothetical protein XELAEV_18013817mg [Xenopus laevis]|uniref:Uncharacterized protein n=1 Tax=Xenopus laevis TaxID=8355 RepID=A0A974DQ40_XENLA|nr:hypothetical protein XELAEV_18013817mg [Xenopus laevis]